MEVTRRFLTLYGMVTFFILLQVAFWGWTRGRLPEFDIVPEVPGVVAVKALSFGDEQFYFRMLGQDIQNAGDSFGRFTELYKYDYKRLYGWFKLLDQLDNESNYIPFLASYYYSQTQHVNDTRYIVDYLYEHAKDRPEQKYWWLAQATYIAQHKLKDSALAIKVAAPLEKAEHAPFWARQLPAFIHEKRGEMDDAYRIIQNIQEHSDEIPPGELRFMEYFVKERLHRLENLENPQ